jgi:hypothetical protein
VSQKLLFNNLAAQPLIPLATGEAVLFHRLTNADSNVLWALHLWVATNNTIAPDAEEGTLIVFGTPPGEGPLSPNGTQLAVRVFRYRDTAAFPDGDAEVGDQNTIKLICDGIPVRGAMDIYVVAAFAGQEPPVYMTAFGYVVRGEAASKTERRFFDPSGDIGDQVSNFSGGAAQVLAPDENVLLHQSSDDYIDEVTLDMVGLVSTVTDNETLLAVGWTGSPAEAGMTLRVGGANPLRVFDGLPVREGGDLVAVYTQIGILDLAPVVFNGFFVRG